MSNAHKYGSIEYKLHEAKTKIEEALEQTREFRVAQDPIIFFDSIQFGAEWGKKARIGAINDVEWYGKFDRIYYNSFNKEKREHIEKCYNGCLEWAAEAEKEVEKWHEENLPHIEHNKKVRESITNFMLLMGIPKSYSYTEYVGRNKKAEKREATSGFYGDLTRNCKIDDGFDRARNLLAALREDAKNWRARLIAEIEKKEKEVAASEGRLRLIAKSMELAKQWGIEYTTNKELIDLVDERAREEFVKDEYPDGTELTQKCCDDCSDWIVGERRCVCGNRRMELIVEGDVVKGFSAWVQAY